MISLPAVGPLAAQAPAPAPVAVAPAAGTAAAAATTPVDPKVAEAARGFEGLLMSMLVDEMFKGSEIANQPVYGGLMTQTLGDALADSGGIGLASMLIRQVGGGS